MSSEILFSSAIQADFGLPDLGTRHLGCNVPLVNDLTGPQVPHSMAVTEHIHAKVHVVR